MKGVIWLFDANRAACIVDAVLHDLIIDDPLGRPVVGDIRSATVDRVIPKLGGAFVRFADKSNGFLREYKGVEPGQELTVQVRSIPEPGKDTPVSSGIVLKTRALMLTPGKPGVNISRAIRDGEERDRLKELALTHFDPDAPLGVVVRTLAEGIDAQGMAAQAEAALEMLKQSEGGELRSSIEARASAEWPTPDAIYATNEIALDHQSFDGDLFDHFDVESQIDALAKPVCALAGGAHMSIEPTRALVAVDVNTGSDTAQGAGQRANRAAARDLPRQLRLRGLGGQVIVDFAPASKAQRRDVEAALKASLRRDGIETVIAGWTQLGLMELQRKRERRPLTELLQPKGSS